MTTRTIRVAAAHYAPVYFNVEETLNKISDIVAEARANGTKLLAFPESFLPGYPHWGRVVRPIDTDEAFTEMCSLAVRIDGPELSFVSRLAKDSGIILSLGFTEGTENSMGCIWNSNVIFNEVGEIISHRRKLVPTYVEQLIWARGDGYDLSAVDTTYGKLGMLICGENTNPLARYVLIAEGEQIHISTYPAAAPARYPTGGGGYNIREGIRIRAGAHSFEGKLFNIVAATPFDTTAREYLSKHFGDCVPQLLDKGSPTLSMVIDPTGEVVSKVLDKAEGLCFADIDFGQIPKLKRIHDVAGYYNRFDVFQMTIDRRRERPLNTQDARFADMAQSRYVSDNRATTIPSIVRSIDHNVRGRTEAEQDSIDRPEDHMRG